MKREDASEIEISYEAASSQVPVDLYNHLACLLFDNNDARGQDGRVCLLGDSVERVGKLARVDGR